MLGQVGYCNGVETTPAIWPGARGTPPECLIDYFPDDWLLIVDESHVTCSQLQAMYNGDQARKKVLIEHGFRLPSAADNRPLKGAEFWESTSDSVCPTTPGDWEMEVSGGGERVIRPTGVLDPVVEVRPTTGQVGDLLGEIRDRAAENQRVLVQPSPSAWRKTSPITGGERGGALPALRNSLDRADRDHPGLAFRGIRRVGGCEPLAGGS